MRTDRAPPLRGARPSITGTLIAVEEMSLDVGRAIQELDGRERSDHHGTAVFGPARHNAAVARWFEHRLGARAERAVIEEGRAEVEGSHARRIAGDGGGGHRRRNVARTLARSGHSLGDLLRVAL